MGTPTPTPPSSGVPAAGRIYFPIRNHKRPHAVTFLDPGYRAGYPSGGRITSPGTLGFWHTGIDMNGPGACDADLGAAVYAMTDGVVRFAGNGGGSWGGVIVIEHVINGKRYWTRYGHVIGIRVRVGQIVKGGAQIAQIGKGAWACAHLHFDTFHTAPPAGNWAWWPTKNGPQSQVTALLQDPALLLRNAVEVTA